MTLGARLLLTHPSQAAVLREDPATAKQAIEEILRFDPPVQVVPDSDRALFSSARLPSNPAPHCWASSAPRTVTPRSPTTPTSSRIARRTTRPSLSFGAGRHYCPGSAVARTHAQVLFPMLLRRFPGLRLAGTPRFRSPGTMLRGV